MNDLSHFRFLFSAMFCCWSWSAGASSSLALADALCDNTTLRTVNVESNFISGAGIVNLLKGAGVRFTLLELRVANQKPEVLGNKVEMKILELVNKNDTLLRLGIHFEFPQTRIRVNDKLRANFDALRKKRVEGK